MALRGVFAERAMPPAAPRFRVVTDSGGHRSVFKVGSMATVLTEYYRDGLNNGVKKKGGIVGIALHNFEDFTYFLFDPSQT